MEHFYHTIGENWFTYPNLYKNMIHHFRDNSHFVEVGSWRGRSASFMAVEIINSKFNIKFDCVDTWKGSIENAEHNLVTSSSLYDDFIKNISPVIDVINPIRMTSTEAAKLYENETLDFVFIDAGHEYDDVIGDINSWLPKVKKTGMLSGHDFHHPPVSKAVNEYFGEGNYSVSEDCWTYKKNLD
jgi:predicted O-methyltransferase YrrM